MKYIPVILLLLIQYAEAQVRRPLVNGYKHSSTPTPNISVSTSSLTDFTANEGEPSDPKTFTVSGSNLTGNITVTAPTDFELSLDDSDYDSEKTITVSGGDPVGEPVTVYVRISASASTGSVSGDVTLESSGASTRNVAVSGTVSSDAPGEFFKTITIDHTKVSSTQTNYPMLVSGTFDYLRTVANGGVVQDDQGDDITFWDATGTSKLDCDVELYVPSTGQIVVHVKIPTVSSSEGTVIRMYYGNAEYTTYQGDRAATWSNGYAMVCHMNEEITAAGQTLADASGNGLNLTTHSTTTWTSDQRISGKIGYAQITDKGLNQYYSFTSQNLTGAYTLEGWVNCTETPPTNGSNWWSNGFGQGGINWFGAAIRQYNGSSDEVVSSTTVSANTWHHYAFCRNGTSMILYQDGVQVGTGSSATNKVYQYLCNGSAGISHNLRLDENRISTVQRSADWISMQYANHNSPSTFYTVGEETEP
jgi:hypothetical protein